MRFISRQEAAQHFKGKSVAIVGSGPGVLTNKSGFVDSHDVVVRVNNYKLTAETGSRTDVHYSFYGTSIRKTAEELKRDGVNLCMCKCPDAHAIESEWHRRKNKMEGVDYRYIYRNRKDWWFCDTYVPDADTFLRKFNLLGRHIPTTGFAAILDVACFDPSAIYLTGFDFFASKIHNVDEPWREKNTDDPFRHRPDKELEIVALNHDATWGSVSMDAPLASAVKAAEEQIAA